MSRGGPVIDGVVRVFHAGVSSLLDPPGVGPMLRRGTTMITYAGRNFSTPVSFGRHGDTVTIRVMAPDAKNWWRNFEDGGHHATLRLDGADRSGNGVVTRDGAGHVSVTVTLDPLP